jgi:hypothetical protein
VCLLSRIGKKDCPKLKTRDKKDSEVNVVRDGDDADTTRLWHMRLGHAGEKAMQGLVKQGLLKGAKTCKLEFCERKAD